MNRTCISSAVLCQIFIHIGDLAAKGVFSEVSVYGIVL